MFDSSMLYEYCPYIENLQISSFTRLVEALRRTGMSVRKLIKCDFASSIPLDDVCVPI